MDDGGGARELLLLVVDVGMGAAALALGVRNELRWRRLGRRVARIERVVTPPSGVPVVVADDTTKRNRR